MAVRTVGPWTPAPTPRAASGEQWATLLRRIDAEDGIMPPDAVALLTAVEIFAARNGRQASDGVVTASVVRQWVRHFVALVAIPFYVAATTRISSRDFSAEAAR